MQRPDAAIPVKVARDGSLTLAVGMRGLDPVIDQIIDAFQALVDRAQAQHAATVALRELVELKDMEDREGPSTEYRERQGPAWAAARRALAACRDKG